MREGAVAIILSLIVCVPEVLEDQSHVNADIVSSHNDLPASLPGEQGTQKIAGITQTPFHEKKQRQASRRLNLIILVYLWELSEEPGHDAEGSENGGNEG